MAAVISLLSSLSRRLVLMAGLVLGLAAAQPAAAQVDSFFVVDYHSKRILSSHNAQQKRPVASLTKIATACVVLDWQTATQADLSQMATVPPSIVNIPGPNALGFRPGDLISLRDALSAAMMASDNIAAETLAWHVGADLLRRSGQQGDPLGMFVKQMRALSGKLKMTNTRFLNPHGLDHLKVVPTSTAEDMAKLTCYALAKPAFFFYTSQSERRISYLHGGSQRESFLVKNTNQLVGSRGIDGVKTGTTNKAGQCLIITASRKSTVIKRSIIDATVYPHRLIAVILGSRGDRFQDGLGILDQGWGVYDRWTSSGRQTTGAPGETLNVGQ